MILGLRTRDVPAALPAAAVLRGSARSDLELAFHGAGRSWEEDQRRREVNSERWARVRGTSRERKPSPETEIASTFQPLAKYHEAYGPKKCC